jgi:hypothetical protein
MFEKRALRRILDPKGEKIIGSWRKGCDEGICGLHSSPNVIRIL